jgi:hypothetical protein
MKSNLKVFFYKIYVHVYTLKFCMHVHLMGSSLCKNAYDCFLHRLIIMI